MRRTLPLFPLALLVLLAAPVRAQAPGDSTSATAEGVTQRDTLRFRPDGATRGGRADSLRHAMHDVEWLQAPIGDRLLDDPAEWTSVSPRRSGDTDLTLDYNRVDQARNMIRVVRVVDEATESGTARAFISVSTKNGVSYRSHDDVKSSKDLQDAVLAQADRDLEAFERRYRELKDICSIVSSARAAIRTRRGKVEQRAVA